MSFVCTDVSEPISRINEYSFQLKLQEKSVNNVRMYEYSSLRACNEFVTLGAVYRLRTYLRKKNVETVFRTWFSFVSLSREKF